MAVQMGGRMGVMGRERERRMGIMLRICLGRLCRFRLEGEKVGGMLLRTRETQMKRGDVMKLRDDEDP